MLWRAWRAALIEKGLLLGPHRDPKGSQICQDLLYGIFQNYPESPLGPTTDSSTSLDASEAVKSVPKQKT